VTARAVRIGLTGPIGCGKSTVAGWLAETPAAVAIDADLVARQVLEPGTPETAAVYARFGPDLERSDGTLDRAALGRLVFDDPSALRDLEAIIHPAVRPRILATIANAEAAGASLIVIEAIKLVEGGLAAFCDEVWLVTCDPAIQLARTIGRGADPDDARARIASQGDLAERLADSATRVIDTSGTVASVRDEVQSALAAARRRRGGPATTGTENERAARPT
jgi:dephospho-CoA kinase